MSAWTQVVDIVVTAVMPLVLAWIGSVEWRLRKMHNVPDRDEVDNKIQLHQRELKVMQQEMKEDLKRLEIKLDAMLTKLLKD